MFSITCGNYNCSPNTSFSLDTGNHKTIIKGLFAHLSLGSLYYVVILLFFFTLLSIIIEKRWQSELPIFWYLLQAKHCAISSNMPNNLLYPHFAEEETHSQRDGITARVHRHDLHQAWPLSPLLPLCWLRKVVSFKLPIFRPSRCCVASESLTNCQQ